MAIKIITMAMNVYKKTLIYGISHASLAFLHLVTLML